MSACHCPSTGTAESQSYSSTIEDADKRIKDRNKLWCKMTYIYCQTLCFL